MRTILRAGQGAGVENSLTGITPKLSRSIIIASPMRILLTRESVCAADDIDAPHPFSISVEDGSSPMQILRAIRASDYLPKIGGGKATWVASSRSPIGLLAQQWPDPRANWRILPGMEGLDWSEGNLRVHISYLAQIDPEAALSVVERLRLEPT
jgi:hypothetical protein